METGFSLPCSQEPTVGPYPKADESNPHPHTHINNTHTHTVRIQVYLRILVLCSVVVGYQCFGVLCSLRPHQQGFSSAHCPDLLRCHPCCLCMGLFFRFIGLSV